MYEELLPVGLTGAAIRLGVEPLEVIRLMVVADCVTPGFTVTEDHLLKLARTGGIETGWWDDVEVPEDDLPLRARVRAALQLLLDKAPPGTAIRMDNLWRGLPLEDQELVEDALNVLADEEHVVLENHESGVRILIPPGQEAAIRGLVDLTVVSAGLDELVQG